MKYCTYMSALDIQSRTEVVVVLSKLPHLGIPEHHLCRAIHILGHNSYLPRAKGTVLLSIDQLMIDVQVKAVSQYPSFCPDAPNNSGA